MIVRPLHSPVSYNHPSGVGDATGSQPPTEPSSAKCHDCKLVSTRLGTDGSRQLSTHSCRFGNRPQAASE
jgi:hypothetical protein